MGVVVIMFARPAPVDRKFVVQECWRIDYIRDYESRAVTRREKENGSMTQFNDREKAFENRFKREEELKFKIVARRNKLLGQWAAEKLSLDSAAAEVYAKEVVAADFDEPGDEDVMRKVLKDLEGKGIDASAQLVRKEMDRLMSVARDQVLSEN